MSTHMTRNRRFLPVIAAAAMAIGVAIVSSRPSIVGAADTRFGSLQTFLASGGITIAPVTSADDTLFAAGIAPDVAIGSAVGKFGKGDAPTLYQARITVDNLEPPLIQKPMYIVQMTGLALPPLGTHGPVSDTELHHELIVFVDPGSGDAVYAVTGR